jgi:hypothetical protein
MNMEGNGSELVAFRRWLDGLYRLHSISGS